MIRTIIAFRQDEAGDWIAELSCLHARHVRHRPLLENHPWVLEESGRIEHLGTEIECKWCDNLEMPAGLQRISVLGPLLTLDPSDAIPESWRIPAGVWGVLVVLAGSIQVSNVAARIEATLQGPIARLNIPPETLAVLSPAPQTAIELELWSSHD